MKYLNSIVALLVCVIIISCNKNDENTNDELFFSGFYQIDKMTSLELIDLNDDGKFSYDLKNEINNYFNNEIYDLEIRPNNTNDNPYKLISFYLPEPYLNFDYPGHPNGYVEYARGAFGIKYEYNENIILNDQSETKEFCIVTEFELMENSQIKATISKKYYDFGINEWKNLDIEILYVKVE